MAVGIKIIQYIKQIGVRGHYTRTQLTTRWGSASSIPAEHHASKEFTMSYKGTAISTLPCKQCDGGTGIEGASCHHRCHKSCRCIATIQLYMHGGGGTRVKGA